MGGLDCLIAATFARSFSGAADAAQHLEGSLLWL